MDRGLEAMAALGSKKRPVCVLGSAQEVLRHGNLVLGVSPR
jgi:hypothetical protein